MEPLHHGDGCLQRIGLVHHGVCQRNPQLVNGMRKNHIPEIDHPGHVGVQRIFADQNVVVVGVAVGDALPEFGKKRRRIAFEEIGKVSGQILADGVSDPGKVRFCPKSLGWVPFEKAVGCRMLE